MLFQVLRAWRIDSGMQVCFYEMSTQWERNKCLYKDLSRHKFAANNIENNIYVGFFCMK